MRTIIDHIGNCLLGKHLRVIIDPTTSTSEVYSRIKKLWFLGESQHYWKAILVNTSRPAYLRRAAMVQLFLRHAAGRSFEEIGADILDVWFEERQIDELGAFFGSLPLLRKHAGKSIFLLKPDSPRGNNSAIYITCKAGVSIQEARSRLISGVRTVRTIIEDVGAFEELEDGTTITWYRYAFGRRRFIV